MTTLRRRDFLKAVLTVAPVAPAAAAAACRPGADGDGAIGPTLAPSALAARAADISAGKVAVFYVGPGALFERGHIPGARNLGEVDSAEGRRALSAALSDTPQDKEIVVYCGCCPVRSCPNVRPASAAIRASGRKNAFVLDLPTRFATDWADKGYPVARGA